MRMQPDPQKTPQAVNNSARSRKASPGAKVHRARSRAGSRSAGKLAPTAVFNNSSPGVQGAPEKREAPSLPASVIARIRRPKVPGRRAFVQDFTI